MKNDEHTKVFKIEQNLESKSNTKNIKNKVKTSEKLNEKQVLKLNNKK